MAVTEYRPKRFQGYSWAFGNFGSAIMSNVLNVFIIAFYLKEVLVTPSNFDALFVTMVTFSAKLSEGLINVPVARFSDNVRTRFGRRRPFFLLTPVWVVFFVLTFACPFEDTLLILIWLLITYGGFRWTNAAVVNPYLALLPEIAPEEHQRTTYNSYRTLFVLLGTILGILSFPILRDIFAGPFGDTKITAFYATVPVAILTFIGMAIVFFGVKENPNVTVAHFGMIESFKETFKNKSFFPSYLATVSTLMLAESMLLASLPMIAQDYIGLSPDDLMVSLISGIFVVSAILSIPFISILSKRFGKAKVYYYCCLSFGVFAWLLLLVGQIPFITPENTVSFTVNADDTLQVVTSAGWKNFILFQTFLTIMIVGLPVGGVMVLGYSVFSDVIDFDEKLTGQRRESMYFAAQGVVDWFFAAAGDLILGILLTLFGREYFSATFTTESGLLNTGPAGLLLVGPVAGVVLILGALMFRKYPLMEGKQHNSA
ncbi:MAG: MFS transporter [Candidatus Hodarchaeales archaeon]|jgi:GPH family glycoside/pentoside/hexuronide:cation symporter